MSNTPISALLRIIPRPANVFLLTAILYSTSLAYGADQVQEQNEVNCRQVIEILSAQKTEMSQELRQIKRELGLLKVAIKEPGTTEILGGIGYILGLFGISYYWHARTLLKKNK